MIAILGSQGMLGSMLDDTWTDPYWALDRKAFDAEKDNPSSLHGVDRIINCIGIIKPYCDDVARAIRINALFPHSLPEGSIQIATDCVYSGQKGQYVESDAHDATDTYGKTKSLGEAPHLNNLRCSIIGPELKNHVSLHDWFLAQTEAQGFTNHLWNGITTYHFAKICRGIIQEGIELPALQHIVPANVVTKAELLRLLVKAYKKDIPVTNVAADVPVDRTLATLNPELNKRLWTAAGYDEPPTIEQMVEELAAL